MHALTTPIGGDDHVLGRAAAAIELVEYGDYQCPFCARAHHEMTEVLRREGHRIRYAFRHFPLVHSHPHALMAAQAAEAAGAQGRFWPMHSVLFENAGALSEPDLVSYAETIGLEVKRFERDLRSGMFLPKVERDFRSGVRSGVSRTPAFFVGRTAHERGWDAESLVAAIQAASRARPSPPPRPS